MKKIITILGRMSIFLTATSMIFVILFFSGVSRAEQPLSVESFLSLNDAEFYALRGIPQANQQTGARDNNGNLISNPSMDNNHFETFKAGVQKNINDNFCFDFYHINEGHAENNHRDGFGVTGCARMALDDNKHAFVQINAGPYFAMNTISVGGVQYDRKEFGFLVAAVIEKDINNRGLKARLELDHSIMFGNYDGHPTFNGTTAQFGLSQSFDQKINRGSGHSQDDLSNDSVWAVFIGNTKTNSTEGGVHKNLQIKRSTMIDSRYPGLTYSISALTEGDTGVTDRSGVTAQLGYMISSPRGFKAGVEAGTYVSHDSLSGNSGADGLITIYVEKKISGDYSIRVEFERVATGDGPAKDADHFKIGIEENL